MDLISVKILVLTLSGFVRIFFGMIPLVVVKTLVTKWSKATDKRMKSVISVLMFFGGGVLLATCFLHMMPEVRDNFKEAEPGIELPLSEIIFLAGFFLVYMIEDVVHSIVHKHKSHKKKDGKIANSANGMVLTNTNASSGVGKGNHALSSGTSHALHNNDEAIINNSNRTAMTNSNGNNAITVDNNGIHSPVSLSLSSSPHHPEDVNPNHYLRETKEIFRKKSSSSEEIPGLSTKGRIGGIVNTAYVHEKFQYCDPDWMKDMVDNGSNTNSLARHDGGKGTGDCYQNSCSNAIMDSNSVPNNANVNDNGKFNNNNNSFLQVPQFLRSSSARSSGSSSKSAKSHGHMHLPMDNETLDDSIGGEIRNILIVIAISFHGIFEGMAIGLQSSVPDVWYLFLAVSLHECTILFCIGVELISSKTKVFRMVLYILVVSLVSPVGIAIGILVSEKAYGGVIHQALIIGLFQGLAAGTLLYVTFFEIFQEEGKKLHRKCYHILVAVLGFILMGSLEFMGGHNHGGHSHDNHGTAASLGNKTIHDDHDHSHENGEENHSHEHHHPH